MKKVNTKKLLSLTSFVIIFLASLGYAQIAKADYNWSYIDTNADVQTLQNACGINVAMSPASNCTMAKPAEKSGSEIICCFYNLVQQQQQAQAVTTAISNLNKPKFQLPDYVFQIPIGTLTGLKTVDCSSGTCEIPFIAQYIAAIYKYALSIVGVLGVLVLMAAGLLWIVSGGDSGKITTAKRLIFGSITGLLLMLGVNLFLSFVNPDLVNLKSIVLPSIERIEITPEPDADIQVVGGITPYLAGCKANKNGDPTVCAGYGNAEMPGLISAPGKNGPVRIDPTVYQKYQAAMECVKNKNNGKSLFVINEAFRSAATQIEYKKKYGDNAATPCCSNHSSGKAMDLNRTDGQSMSWTYDDSSSLKTCMNAQGLYAKLANEPWHWSETGK